MYAVNGVRSILLQACGYHSPLSPSSPGIFVSFVFNDALHRVPLQYFQSEDKYTSCCGSPFLLGIYIQLG